MSREIEAYLKKIERGLFICPKNKRTSFLRELRGTFDAYSEEHPGTSVQELQSVFGTPESIAEGFLRSEEFATTKKIVSSKRKIVRIVLIAVCALVAAALILGTIFIVDNYGFTHGYMETSPAQEEVIPQNPNALSSY